MVTVVRVWGGIHAHDSLTMALLRHRRLHEMLAENQTCSSLVRMTSLTSKSFVRRLLPRRPAEPWPGLPFKTISWACSSREICTGTASPRARHAWNQGHLARHVPLAMLTPPSALDAFGQCVDQLALLLEVLVEQEV